MKGPLEGDNNKKRKHTGSRPSLVFRTVRSSLVDLAGLTDERKRKKNIKESFIDSKSIKYLVIEVSKTQWHELPVSIGSKLRKLGAISCLPSYGEQ